MENLVNGLNLLMGYVQQINRVNALQAADGEVIIVGTDRQMTYDDVRALKSLGWNQEGEYNVTKPWFYRT